MLGVIMSTIYGSYFPRHNLTQNQLKLYKNQVMHKVCIIMNISVSWKYEWTYLGCGTFLEDTSVKLIIYH